MDSTETVDTSLFSSAIHGLLVSGKTELYIFTVLSELYQYNVFAELPDIYGNSKAHCGQETSPGNQTRTTRSARKPSDN